MPKKTHANNILQIKACWRIIVPHRINMGIKKKLSNDIDSITSNDIDSITNIQ